MRTAITMISTRHGTSGRRAGKTFLRPRRRGCYVAYGARLISPDPPESCSEYAPYTYIEELCRGGLRLDRPIAPALEPAGLNPAGRIKKTVKSLDFTVFLCQIMSAPQLGGSKRFGRRIRIFGLLCKVWRRYFGCSGRSTEKVVPFSLSLVTETRPSRRSTICFVIDSPSPWPPVSPWRLLSPR